VNVKSAMIPVPAARPSIPSARLTAFAVPAIGVMVYGTFEGGGTSFLAAVVSACLFGVTTLLNFGPDEA